ncbi:hypothetical protein NECAME_07603 [Necator americanus]|uniref:Uncharacterized protein n=1 Tax=Necator americanus TaxID=51031 RepID=W2TPE8_NECAM|nr:hypothetical protein NECAME_07603 [Necator americanus]ETN83011.1 hypothetical protein NECAME_07603 [Necator americanus]
MLRTCVLVLIVGVAAAFDSSEIRMLEDGYHVEKRAAPIHLPREERSFDENAGPLIRFGKRDSQGAPLIRFGRAPEAQPLIRFGKRSPDSAPLIRFGRDSEAQPLIRFGKRSPAAPFIRFGRSVSAPLVRFGRSVEAVPLLSLSYVSDHTRKMMMRTVSYVMADHGKHEQSVLGRSHIAIDFLPSSSTLATLEHTSYMSHLFSYSCSIAECC